MVAITSQPTSLRLRIDGLDCPSCARRVERAIRDIPGVQNSTVFSLEQVLQVETDGTTDPAALASASTAVGLTATLLPTIAPQQHEWLIDGMDCADCARKIDRAVSRLPGVSDLTINAGNGRLRLTLDEGQTAPATVVRLVRSLGYTPRTSAPSLIAPTPWYQTAKGRLVIASGLLLLAAAICSVFLPVAAPWAYGAATLIAVFPVARKAWGAARAGSPFDINALVAIAALGALIIGEAAEGAVVVFLFAIGELLEGYAAGRARHSIGALAAITPKTALLVSDTGTTTVPADSLAIGDQIRVLPGERVPADGRIVSGESAVNEAPITGEAVPVNKEPGATVYAGSINTNGTLLVAVTAEAQDTTLARIITLVTEAEAGKSPTARFIDRFAQWYTPAVLLTAILVACVPPLLFGEPWLVWVYKGLALLLIGCPCALVLSTPAAVTSAISAGARQGLLLKSGAALEALSTIRTVAFDKTGTLTVGEPQVTDIIPLSNLPADELLSLAAALETTSTHPLAQAIVATAMARDLPLATPATSNALPGQAVSGTVGGREITVGSPRHATATGTFTTEQTTLIADLEAVGKTVVVVTIDQQIHGLIALRDEPRAEAATSVAALRKLGVTSVMLTGDNARTAQAIGNPLGVTVQAELLPQDKVTAISAALATGPVAMVGDGINDAPALATATVGIAMGSGSAVALETADAALLRPSVHGVPALVRLSRATMGNIRQNITFALVLKGIFLVTTILGITNLWVAVLSDTGATALVTLNALRLLRFKADE